MNFCNQCGGPVTLRIPPGDNLPRHVCDRCGAIHYLNPRLVVGALVEWEGSILMCRRAIEPRYGKWTLPAGFMENGESIEQAAARETFEEAGARIEIGPLFSVISVPHIDQVHVVHRARLLDLDFAPGDESLETVLMAEQEIPWDEIAFHTISLTLKLYFGDRARGRFQVHSHALAPQDQPSEK